MEITIIIVVFGILAFSYWWFGEQQKKKDKLELEKIEELGSFFRGEINNIQVLKLVSADEDGNSDYNIADAIKNIKMSNETRIKIYD